MSRPALPSPRSRLSAFLRKFSPHVSAFFSRMFLSMLLLVATAAARARGQRSARCERRGGRRLLRRNARARLVGRDRLHGRRRTALSLRCQRSRRKAFFRPLIGRLTTCASTWRRAAQTAEPSYSWQGSAASLRSSSAPLRPAPPPRRLPTSLSRELTRTRPTAQVLNRRPGLNCADRRERGPQAPHSLTRPRGEAPHEPTRPQPTRARRWVRAGVH